MLRCREIMKGEVHSCRTQDPAYRAAEIMASKAVGFLPVVDSMRRLVGVITDRDLVVRLLAHRKDAATRVDALMTAPVIACRALDPLTKVDKIMADHTKSRIPVVDDFGECVGIISLSDIAQSTAHEEAGQLLQQVTQRASQTTVH